MIKLKKIFLILIVSISAIASQFIGAEQIFADTLSEETVNDSILFDDIQYPTLDPSTIINLDENPNYFEDPINSRAISCGYKSYEKTSASGSKILLYGDSPTFGYCHIKDRHMQITGMDDLTIGNASQFWGSYSALGMMDLVMQVVDGTTVLKPTNDPNRKTKQTYISLESNNVLVVLHKGSDWAGYGKYDWVVISAYPVFVPNHAR
ncbi:hypothetical protein LYSIN_01129 [Lysinibacillus sphaericus]|uniref:Uncharacterized protein n=1 Tax=Lysinibacillus sphaericus TaxID=1421 RepID=A0A2S5CZW4_LYSSH|nr:hypothetical protein [Lysinibacillus sphaericus]POZ56346.1 hypothetical protein LYSIN_01129 [Lysinibacillus sphaericus]